MIDAFKARPVGFASGKVCRAGRHRLGGWAKMGDGRPVRSEEGRTGEVVYGRENIASGKLLARGLEEDAESSDSPWSRRDRGLRIFFFLLKENL